MFEETLTTKFNLVCDNVEKRHFIGSVMMLGLTIGSLLGGPLSEFILFFMTGSMVQVN